MTLIAAFRVMGTPALLGDLLLTSAPDRQSSRKKVVVVADNLAIAWTGHLLAAELVLSVLNGSSRPPTPNFLWLQRTLTSLDPKEFGQLRVTLVGWLVESGIATCFRWRSDYGCEVFTGDLMTDGSGEDYIVELLAPSGLTSISPGAEGWGSKRQRGMLTILVGRLMQRELHGPTTRPFGFGHGYEAVLLSESGQFEYLEILYYAIQYKMSPSGMCEGYRLVRPIVSISHASGFTIVRRLDTATGRDRDKRELITPPGAVDLEAERQLMASMSRPDHKFVFHGLSYCQFVFFDPPSFEDVPVVYIHGDVSSGEGFVVDEGDRLFAMPRKVVESLYEESMRDKPLKMVRTSFVAWHNPDP